MAKRWVTNTTSTPTNIGGKLCQRGEGNWVDDGPLAAAAPRVAVFADPVSGALFNEQGQPIPSAVSNDGITSVAAAAGVAVGTTGRAVSAIGVKCLYGYMDSGSHGVNRNTHVQTVLETDADWIQIGLLNGISVPITGVRVAIGVAAALGADGSAATYTPDAWADVTWGGAATVDKPAGAAARPSVVLSDRIYRTTVARSDGGTFPVLHTRILEPSANANVSKWSPGGVMAWMRSESNTAGRVCRVMQQDGGDYVAAGGRATFNATADASRWTPFFIVYGARNGTVTTVFVVGDSIRAGVGATNYLQGHHWQARERMSTAAQPIELANFGWSGQTMPNYCNRALDLIAAGVVQSNSILALGTFSPNDFTTAVTTAGIDTMRSSLASVMAAATSANVKVLLEDGAPANPAQKDWNASDSLRVGWNAEIASTYAAYPRVGFAARLSAAVADGDGQINFAVGLTTDNLHLNDAGYAAVLDDTVLAVNTYARWRVAQTAVAELVGGKVVGMFAPDGSSTRFQMQTIRFNGSANSQFFTVPDGCTVLEADASGPGGGGGGGHATGGGGGGGSAGQQVYRRRLAVQAGETLTINCPTGGAAGAVGSNGGIGSGVSGSLLTVTGSKSGLLLSLTTGGGGKAGTGSLGGNGGDGSGPIFSGGVSAPAAGTAGSAGTDYNTINNVYGSTGALGGTGCISTGASITGGRGGRTTSVVQNGAGGASGAVSGNGGGGGGAGGYPDNSVASSASGGTGGADSVAGTDGLTPGAGGGGGGRNAAGGKGADAFVRFFY